MAKERIDKIISNQMNYTRTQARRLIKIGRVTVNGKAVNKFDFKADSETDNIVVDGEALSYNKFVYIMMNKPKGVISASKGNNYETVIDILPKDFKRKNLFPAGRLDKDTTGFMLITDDGDFAHDILAPKKHVPKTYIATLDKPINAEITAEFKNGISLKDKEETTFQSALLENISDDKTVVKIVINEGKYHQIKRMFMHFGIEVMELHRLKIGDLELDSSLKSGECRFITDDEIKKVCVGR